MALLLIDMDCANPIAGAAAQAADKSRMREKCKFIMRAPGFQSAAIWEGYRSYAGAKAGDAKPNVTSPQWQYARHRLGRCRAS
jgi:hypothetical protein